MEKNEWKLYHEECSNDGISTNEDGQCLIPAHKKRFITIINKWFQEVDEQWGISNSKRVVDILEHLVFKSIDLGRLKKECLLKDGSSFSFNLVRGVYSDELLDVLMEHHSDEWHFIQEVFMQDGKVNLEYDDRYLNTPLGCLMLAQFIRRIRDLFGLNYCSIVITLSRRGFYTADNDNPLKIDQKFTTSDDRDGFFRICMDRIVRSPYQLIVRNTKHARALVIRNCQYELSICPDGGFSHGWGIENGIHSGLTIDRLKENPDINVHCFNRNAHSFDKEGIPYVIRFSPL